MERVFTLLKDNHISQKQLSDAIGVSTGNISDWKSGKASPKASALIRIADYFNVSVDYLLERTDVREMAGSSSELERLNAQLDEVGRARLLAYADDLVSSGKYKKGTISEVG